MRQNSKNVDYVIGKETPIPKTKMRGTCAPNVIDIHGAPIICPTNLKNTLKAAMIEI